MVLSVKLAIACMGFVAATAGAVAKPVVVELFTSQGCSSCPPADAVLTELSRRTDVLPLAFHVTYWNALGWRDPYSFEAATDRQAHYAGRLGGGSYTPEIVVDGRRGMVGSDRGAVAGAIAASRGAGGVPIKLNRSGATVTISLERGTGQGQVLLIGFDPRHETSVGRGENGGRTLVESNIVRSMQTIGAYRGEPVRFTASSGAGEDLAVLVQAADGAIIGAARP